MHLSDNLNIVSKLFPDTYDRIKDIGRIEGWNTIKPETARNGMPTILYESNSGQVYIHSKYDPVKEAERFIGQYNEVDRYKHVFFYGIGLGYHVEEFCRRWPDKKYILYEPESSIFLNFIKERSLAELPLSNCSGIYTGSSQGEIEQLLHKYVNQINGEVLFVTLPSYERIFGNFYKDFLKAFQTAVMNKRATLNAEAHFQKLWAINSIKNFRAVINSTSILQYGKDYFAGKPAIIAAAGPSLMEELDNLKLIKDKGLAYIFSVGSAVNTLVSSGILPHAACIYDPGANTNQVIKIIKEQNLDIPLIFGSSVYAGTLEDYPGSMHHIITSQDTISPFFLKNSSGEELARVMDAPSISIITLQMLIMLGCSPIILVGQNFAFKNSRYYAQGIEYKGRSGLLCDIDLADAYEVEDVTGGRVLTSQPLDQMRKQMEMYISHFGCNSIINATKGGAKISGTVYKPLEELLKKELTGSTVDENWGKDEETPYDIDHMISQGKLMSEDMNTLQGLITELIDELRILNSDISGQLLKKALDKFIKAYNKLIENRFFMCVLRPMNRVQFEKISKNIPDISLIQDVKDRARFVAETFDNVFEACARDINSIRYDFYDLLDEIFENDIKVMTFTINAS